MVVESYDSYLKSIEFSVLKDAKELNTEMLDGLERKNGYVIENDIYVCRNFEPTTFLNQIIIMESTVLFNVIDAFGMIMFKGSAEEVVEYVDGFFSDDDEFSN